MNWPSSQLPGRKPMECGIGSQEPEPWLCDSRLVPSHLCASVSSTIQ